MHIMVFNFLYAIYQLLFINKYYSNEHNYNFIALSSNCFFYHTICWYCKKKQKAMDHIIDFSDHFRVVRYCVIYI